MPRQTRPKKKTRDQTDVGAWGGTSLYETRSRAGRLGLFFPFRRDGRFLFLVLVLEEVWCVMRCPIPRRRREWGYIDLRSDNAGLPRV